MTIMHLPHREPVRASFATVQADEAQARVVVRAVPPLAHATCDQAPRPAWLIELAAQASAALETGAAARDGRAPGWRLAEVRDWCWQQSDPLQPEFEIELRLEHRLDDLLRVAVQVRDPKASGRIVATGRLTLHCGG